MCVCWLTGLWVFASVDTEAVRLEIKELRQKVTNTLRQDPKSAIDPALKAFELAQQINDVELTTDTGYQLALAYFRSGQTGRALEQTESVLLLTDTTLKSESLLDLRTIQGSLYAKMGRLREAARVFEDAIPLSRSLDSESKELNLMHNISIVYLRMGKFDLALEYNMEVLRRREEKGDRSKIANTLNSIASIYSSIGDLEKSLQYLQKSLAIKRLDGVPYDIGIALGNIGSIYTELGELEVAMSYLEEALAIKQQAGNDESTAITMCSLGSVLSKLGQIEKAERYLREALKIQASRGLARDEIDSLLVLSGLLRMSERGDEALAASDRALKIINETGTESMLASVLEERSLILEMNGDYEGALLAFRRFKETRERILDEDTQLKIADLQGQIDADQKSRELELLRRDTQIESLELKRKVWVRNGWIAGLCVSVLMVLILFLLWNRSRQRQLNARLESMVSERTLHLLAKSRQVAEMHQKLVEAAHHAGKAELAMGVLHHLGNSLNSVNISASVLCESLDIRKSSRLLGDIANLLAEQQNRMTEFLERDPRGQKLPHALRRLVDKIQTEHLDLKQEAQSLMQAIHEMTGSLRAQQINAKVNWLYEEVEFAQFIQQIYTPFVERFLELGVEFELDCPNDLRATIQGVKVSRVLSDLLSFAVSELSYAVKSTRRLMIRATCVDGHLSLVCLLGGKSMRHLSDATAFAAPSGRGELITLHDAANVLLEMDGSLKLVAAEGKYTYSIGLQLPVLVELIANT